MEGQVSAEVKPIIDKRKFSLIYARQGKEKAVNHAKPYVSNTQIELWVAQLAAIQPRTQALAA